MDLIEISLPSRTFEKNGERIDVKYIFENMIMCLPFWRLGKDIKRLDAYEAIAAAVDKLTAAAQMSLTAGQKEFLVEAMEMANASIPDYKINRLYNEIFRELIAAK